MKAFEIHHVHVRISFDGLIRRKETFLVMCNVSFEGSVLFLLHSICSKTLSFATIQTVEKIAKFFFVTIEAVEQQVRQNFDAFLLFATNSNELTF